MNGKDKDALLSDALKRGTDGAARQKERVWQAVSAGISKTRKERDFKEMIRKRNYLLAGALTATAVLLSSVFFP